MWNGIVTPSSTPVASTMLLSAATAATWRACSHSAVSQCRPASTPWKADQFEKSPTVDI